MRLEDSVFLTSPNGRAGGNQGLREAVGLDQGCIAREQDIPSLLSSPFSGGQEGSQPGPGQRWPHPQLSRSLERLPPEGDSDSTLWHCAPCSSMTSFYFANYSYKPVPQLFPSFISVCVWGVVLTRATVSKWRSEDNLGCWSSPLTSVLSTAPELLEPHLSGECWGCRGSC